MQRVSEIAGRMTGRGTRIHKRTVVGVKMVLGGNVVEHKNAVLQGLENMRDYDGFGHGLVYGVHDKEYTTDQMIAEIKNDTEVGREFSQRVYDTIVSYLGKFTQNAG